MGWDGAAPWIGSMPWTHPPKPQGRLGVPGACNESPVLNCSYNFDQPTNRMMYEIYNAAIAYYFTSTAPSTKVPITLYGGAAKGFVNFSNLSQTITVVAEGCGCPARCTLGNCCSTKDYLRQSISGLPSSYNQVWEATRPPPTQFIEQDRTTYARWEVTITGLSGINGTWLAEVTSPNAVNQGECQVNPIDTGVDVSFVVRWTSEGAQVPSIFGGLETWTQDMTGTATGRAWIGNSNIWIVGPPGTMVGTATKTAGATGPYSLTYDSVWSPEMMLDSSTSATPYVSIPRGLVAQFSAHPTHGFGSLGQSPVFAWARLRCGQLLTEQPRLQLNEIFGIPSSSQGFVNQRLTGGMTRPYPSELNIGSITQEYISVP